MDFFELDPEVAGGLGEDCEIDHSTTPLTVLRLYYEIETWLGSEMLTSFPVYLVTERLRDEIDAAGLTGVVWDDARVTIDEQGREYMASLGRTEYPQRWAWLKPVGAAGVDDLGLERPGHLVVSQTALDVIGPRLGEDYVLDPWPPRDHDAAG